jgi:hypothetical protein
MGFKEWGGAEGYDGDVGGEGDTNIRATVGRAR